MKKFKFSFETLEKVRKARENEMMRLLSRAQSEYRAASEKKSQLSKELEIAQTELSCIADVDVTPAMIATQWDHITGLKQRLIQQEQAILRAKRGVEKTLRSFLIARRQTRMIEVLREKAYAEYRKQLQKHEAKKLDDIYIMRASRMDTQLEFLVENQEGSVA